MADDAEDVLELDTDLELDVEEPDDPEQTDGEVAEDGSEQDFDFGEDGAAPAPESSVIRDLRKRERDLVRANREMARKLGEQNKPQPVEIGPKPTLASCDYDEDRFEADLDHWKALKAQADRADQQYQEQRQAEAQTWQGVKQAYEADKASLKVSGYADAEDEVFAALPEQHQALLMKSGKAAPLVVALSRNPEKLQELSEMNLADAAMMIGELRGKLQMKTRPSTNPERRVTGNAGFSGGSDKQLAKLKAKAEQSGDFTEYFAAKRKASA
jgi:hypothetical protein